MEDSEMMRGRSRRRPTEPGTSRARKTGSTAPEANRHRGRIKRFVILGIAEVVVLVAIFAYAYVLKQYSRIQRPEVDLEQVRNTNLSVERIKEMDEGFWNIAVFGVDSRDSSVGKGSNADVIIIVSINRANGEIRLVSVFRDTYLKTGDNVYNKINAAYCNGGPEQALKALNENLDLNITDYATFNWRAVATGINILGGVDVDLSKAEYYYINSYITETVKGTGIGSVQLSHGGMNHLDGVQAVAYARLRYMDNDYARTERQRKIIELCFQKAKQADIKTLNDLLGNMLSMVATNLTWQDGIDAIASIDKYSIAETAGFPFARGEAVVGKRGSCVIPQTLESNVRELHRFLFNEEDYQVSDAVRTIGAKISADSGMYNEGKIVGHVSTASSYIPALNSSSGNTKSDAVSSESTASSETREGESEGAAGGQEDVEYAISRDGYLIYVDGADESGEKKYKYVLDEDGKRIKMVETDPDGNLIYLYELDENGKFNLNDILGITGTESSSELETDEDGNPVTTSVQDGPQGPGGPGSISETTKSSKDKPAPTSGSGLPSYGPGMTTAAETTQAEGPGGSDIPTAAPEPSSYPQVPTAPESTASSQGPGVSQGPGSSQGPGNVPAGPGGGTTQISSGPGSISQGPG